MLVRTWVPPRPTAWPSTDLGGDDSNESNGDGELTSDEADEKHVGRRYIRPHTVTTHARVHNSQTNFTVGELASCLIYARPLRPDRWLVGARFVDSWRPFRVLVWVRSFIEPIFLKTMYHSTYHSNLSDQSALEIGLGLGLDSELHYFSIFFTENKENEHLFFREYHVR